MFLQIYSFPILQTRPGESLGQHHFLPVAPRCGDAHQSEGARSDQAGSEGCDQSGSFSGDRSLL